MRLAILSSAGDDFVFAPSRVSAIEMGEAVKTARGLPFFSLRVEIVAFGDHRLSHVSGQSSMFNQFQSAEPTFPDIPHEIAFIGWFLWSEVLVSAVLPLSTSLHGSEDLHGLSA
ncbi:MAG: hypothetical protein QM784_26340 [Polyangiaceae bacterium]